MSSKDSLGDRMKMHEDRTRFYLPRRTYTIIRLDGKSFHTFTRGCKKPFDRSLMDCMQAATLKLCEEIQNVKIGYTQSDEITLVLTDFDERGTCQWFDGNLQKMVSVSASIATAEFNLRWSRKATEAFYETLSDVVYDRSGIVEEILNFQSGLKSAHFDSRAYTVSDPWEALNSVQWRQMDASKNSIQMVAKSLYSHKELQNKNTSQLQEMIHQKGQNWNDYPIDCKRGAFVVRGECGWFVDCEGPILTQDRDYFFSRVPQMELYESKSTCSRVVE